MAKPTIAEIRRIMRSFVTAHKKLRSFYGKALSNAKLIQIAQTCVTPTAAKKPVKKPVKKPAVKKPAVKKPAAKKPPLTVAPPAPAPFLAPVPDPIPATVPLGQPTLFRALQIVMGKQPMTTREMLNALGARNWLPLSNNPERFVYTFVSNSRCFQRVPGPGAAVYRLRARYVRVEVAKPHAEPSPLCQESNKLAEDAV